MADEKEHTTQGGVDWELRSAEDGMVAAQDRKALAVAMRRHSDGVRNMMVSELVPSFENAIDRIMQQRVVEVLASVQKSLDTQMGLVERILAATKEHGLGLKKHAKEIKELQSAQIEHAARLNALDDIEAWRIKVDQQLVEDGTRMSKIEQQDRDDIRTEIKSTNAEIVSMKEMLKRYDSELRELVDRLAARGGNENGSG